MIYPVLCYHDGSYRTCNTAVNMGFRQAVQWFHQTAAELPPLLQYRSFVHPENGVYGALLTTAEPFADRDGRNTPTKIMLILDGTAAAELMEDPRRIPALAACMRERLADPGGACAMDKLPDLSCWMERQKATEVRGEEVDLICRAVRTGMEGKRQICCVTDRWETLLAALQELPVSQRCRTAFSVFLPKMPSAPLLPQSYPRPIRSICNAATSSPLHPLINVPICNSYSPSPIANDVRFSCFCPYQRVRFGRTSM